MLIVCSCCAFCTISQNSDVKTTADNVSVSYNRHKFAYIPSTIKTRSDFGTYLDGLFPSGDSTGVVDGYIPAAVSQVIGLNNVGHHFSCYSVSADQQLLVAISSSGASINTLYKENSSAWTWIWKTVSLT